MVKDIHRSVEAQPPDANFLTPRDIQRELQIGERLTYKLLRAQAIPNTRVGNLYRVRREDLEKALEGGAVLEVS